ncbi:MAG: signal peptidase II [Candidatus Moranbacteria bacterium]|nr:signal peptidase II [Candidatus Moranbacteria bacterium]
MLKKIKSRGFLRGIFAIGSLIILDQIIKYFILSKNFIHTCNQGIAFGIKMPLILLAIIWLPIMIYVFYLWWKKVNKKLLIQIPFLLIISGGLGNVIDRAIHGCVIDYIPFLNISTFNLADSFITIGVVLIILINDK